MEIRVYNRELVYQGIIEDQSSLLWQRKYFEPGSFELHLPLTAHGLALLPLGNLITIPDREDAGVVEDIECTESEDGGEIVAKGRFLASYFDRRVIQDISMSGGPVWWIMEQLAITNGITPIPGLTTGRQCTVEVDISTRIRLQNALTAFAKLAKAGGYGYRIRPDFKAKKLYLDTFVGVDRTLSQTANSRVIFAEDYGNLYETTYRTNDQSEANFAYILAKDGETEHEFTLNQNPEAPLTGLDRREIYVDATDVSREEGMSFDSWQARVLQKARNTLNANAKSEAFEADTMPDGNFVYRRDYDLGDIVTVQKESWGIERDLRITEIEESYENGVMLVTPTFGTPLPTALDWGD